MPESALTCSTTLRDMRCDVVLNEDCGRDLKRLRLRSLEGTFACLPGQFVMLDLPNSDFRFRRPFSVLDCVSPDMFDIYYKVVGYGTTQMASWTAGVTVNCLGSLGNTFPTPKKPETALYIGGGIGIAPLYFMAKQLSAKGDPLGHCIYGGRSASDVGLKEELTACFDAGQLHYATDDGSLGVHGNVVAALSQMPERIAAAQEAYICGPARMMEAVSEFLHKTNPAIQRYVSLESHMPCGTGACTSCVIPRPEPNLPAKVCVEGPVFNASDILWHFPDALTMPVSCFPADANNREAFPCP